MNKMTTTTIAATTEQALSRRQMLIGLAAASTAAATAVMPSPALPAQVMENPKLIRLGDDLPKHIAAFETARNDRLAIIRAWKHKWPLAPDSITEIPDFDTPFHSGKELDMFGAPFKRPGEKHPRLISSGWRIESSVKSARRALRSKKMAQSGHVQGMPYEQWEDILKEALAVEKAHNEYTTAVEDFYFLSGYKAAHAAFNEAAERLVAHVNAILRQQDYSMEGILVKAQAIRLQADPDLTLRSIVAEGGGLSSWAASLGESILRLAGEGRA